MRGLRLTVMVVCALAVGCSMLPPSQEKEPLAKALEENRRLKEELQAEVQVNYRLAYELEMKRIELQKAQAGLAAREAKPADTVAVFQDYEVDHIQLGLLTGPSDWDGVEGYDGIAAFLLLRDSDGEVLKRKGNCAFDLVGLSRDRDKPMMSWGVPAEVLGKHWRSVPPGFRIRLPWQGDAPYGEECVLRATFTDAFGRTFTTSRLLQIERKHTPRKDADEQTSGDSGPAGEAAR